VGRLFFSKIFKFTFLSLHCASIDTVIPHMP
jgi:hypothetical protein